MARNIYSRLPQYSVKNKVITQSFASKLPWSTRCFRTVLYVVDKEGVDGEALSEGFDSSADVRLTCTCMLLVDFFN